MAESICRQYKSIVLSISFMLFGKYIEYIVFSKKKRIFLKNICFLSDKSSKKNTCAVLSSAGIVVVQDFALSYSKSLRIRPTSVYAGKVSRRGCWSYLSQRVRGAQSQDRSPSGVLYQSGGYRDTTTYLSWGY